MFSNFKIIIFLSLLLTFLHSKDLDKVSLQFQWLDQFQFAGYYVAKEKGFYEDENLDVEFKKFKKGIIPVDEVDTQRATFGIGRSSLLVDKSNGKDIKFLMTLFQESPVIIMASQNANIKILNDLENKTIMVTPDTSTNVTLDAMLSSQRIDINSIKKIHKIQKVKNLLEGKVDSIVGYSTTQLYDLKQKGLDPIIFKPKDYGFDFYNDILFTSQKEYKSNPKRVESFKKATLKGWEYVFDNIDECVDLVYKKYNPQNKTKQALKYEALAMKELVLKDGITLGDINLNKLDKIYNVYNLLGLIHNKYDINTLIINDENKDIYFTKEELDYIKSKKSIKYSEVNWKPLSIIEDSKMKGIMGDYLNLVSKKSGLKFEFVPSSSWSEVLQKFKDKKIDVIPGIGSSNKEQSLGLISKPYASYPMVIVTNKKYRYIDNLKKLEGKIIAVPKDYTSYYFLQNEYPKIDLIVTSTIEEALLLVAKEKADAFVGHIATSLYTISEQYLENLKISGLADFKFEHHYLIQNEDKILLSIVNKVLNSINTNEIKQINDTWINTKIEQKTDYKSLFIISGIFIVLIVLLILRQRVLRKYNEKLKSSYNELEKLLNSTLEAIVIVKDNICVDINKSAKELLKIDDKSLIVGKNICEYFDGKSFLMYEKNIIDTDNNVFEINLLKSDKEVFPALLKNTRIKYKNDDVNLVSLIDLSGIKEKEKLLIEQSKMAALGEMIGNIAHQWRQPLSVISTIASTYKVKHEFGHEVVGDDFIYEMDQINSNAQYLSKTIDDFKNFIKKDISQTKVNINEIIRHTISIEESLIKNNQINLVFDIDESIFIKCFKNELMQGLINIINNSIDAMKNIDEDKRYIYVSVKKEENKNCIIKIKDSGDGIPQNILSKVFEPYFTTKHASQGTGLGLYMTYSIIKKLDGELQVINTKYSEGDKILKGAEFIITLPL